MNSTDNSAGTQVKPPRFVPNVEWIRKGVGWDCRQIYRIGKQRKRRYIGHLNRTIWLAMLQQHTGDALAEAVHVWASKKLQAKGATI